MKKKIRVNIICIILPHNLTFANTFWIDDTQNLQTQIDYIKSNVPLLKVKQNSRIVELNCYIHLINSPLN
jgi:hypothetical protein